MKSAVFWNVLREPTASIFRVASLLCTEDEGMRFLRNTRTSLPDYTVSQHDGDYEDHYHDDIKSHKTNFYRNTDIPWKVLFSGI
jgi:hypothetical protein